MAHISKTVSIAAAPDKVMGYVSDVHNHTAFIPPLKSVDEIGDDGQKVGATWKWTFDMGGVELHGSAETVEYTPGSLFSYKTNGGIESTFSYSATADGDRTNLVIDVEYAVPDSVLGKIADKAVLENMNQAQADAAAENIKAILEG